MAIYRTECGGHSYKYIEKGDRACLIEDDTRLLWWGAPSELIPCAAAPLEVLLCFSLLQKLDKKP